MKKLQLILRCLLSLLVVFTFQSNVYSAKIVFLFTGANLSHKISIWPLVYALAERGHEITFLSSNSKVPKSHPNIKDIAPAALVKATEVLYELDRFQERNEAGDENKSIGRYSKGTLSMCEMLLNVSQTDPQLGEIFGNQDQYDLAIVNSVFGECGLLLTAYYGWKFIVYSAIGYVPWYTSVYGVPMPASWIPELTFRFKSSPMTFWNRVRNVISHHELANRDIWLTHRMEMMMKERFNMESGQVPSFIEVERNASLVFVNSHPAIDFARPLPPMFIRVGGMQCWNPVGNLSQDFQEFMDNAEDGVILISFGSTMDLSQTPKTYINILFSMMRKFNSVRFIWRWKGKLPDKKPPNLMSAEWLPQREILKHPKMKAFMSHCGQNSVTEATCSGVPLIASPLFGDQDLVAYRIQAQQLGVKVEIKGLTQQMLNSVVEDVLHNSKYKVNMASRSRIIKDQPQNPIDTAVFWTEFVLRHEDMSAFKPLQLEQSVFVRHNVDVYFVIFLGLTVLPLSMMYVVISIVRKLL